MEHIELFLSPADDGGQTLEGVDGDSPSKIGIDEAKKVPAPEKYPEPGEDPNDLFYQGWGVVVPDNDHGSRLLEVIKPLIDKRKDDMEVDEIMVYRVPVGMHAPEALRWREDVVIANNGWSKIPGYMVVLGDLDGVTIETQQVLSTKFNVGRVGFAEEAHYQSYVDKLLRWENGEPSGEARTLFFSAMDDTPATRLGDSQLIRPIATDALARMEAGELPVSEVLHLFDEDPIGARSLLLEQASTATSSILFSCSHGLGAPRNGWKNFDRQRALQGAMYLGGRECIDAEAVANIPFLPGGMWIFFACFGAGTPAVSEYRHWLSRLKKVGQYSGNIDGVLASLPKDGDPPFIAALPQAVLANPDGPLAVLGHIDLAWSYSFQALDGEASQARDSRFRTIVKEMAKGRRAGVAIRRLLLAREGAKDALLTSVDEATRAAEEGTVAPDDRKRIGHKWMMHQDLNGYVLLGDPAARLAVKPKKRKPVQQATTPAPEIRSPAPPVSQQTATAPQQAASAPQQTTPPVAQPANEPEPFRWFTKDDDEGQDGEAAKKEPGFIARFTQKVGETLSNVLQDAVTLDVKTYTGSNVQAMPTGEHEMDADPNVFLLAHTRSKLDGDTYQFWATDEDGDTEQVRQLRSLHLKMLEQAQAHRNELLRILLSMIRPGT